MNLKRLGQMHIGSKNLPGERNSATIEWWVIIFSKQVYFLTKIIFFKN
jgi:hypothetical protein